MNQPSAKRARGIHDLEEALFEQMERLTTAKKDDKELPHEIERTRAMVNIAEKILAAGHYQLAARRAANEFAWNEPLPLGAERGVKQLTAGSAS